VGILRADTVVPHQPSTSTININQRSTSTIINQHQAEFRIKPASDDQKCRDSIDLHEVEAKATG
jgi:hypothetical protein